MGRKKHPGPLFQNIDLPVEKDFSGTVLATIRHVLKDVNQSMSPSAKKREVPIEEKLKSAVKVFCSERLCGLENASVNRERCLSAIEMQITTLFKDLIRLKIDVAEKPKLLQTRYPTLATRFLEVCHERLNIKEKVEMRDQSDKSDNELRGVAILCQMMELNISVRSCGCAKALVLSEEKLRSSAKKNEAHYRKTKLGNYLTKVQRFEEDYLYRCYGTSGDIDFSDRFARQQIKWTGRKFYMLMSQTIDLYCDPSPLGILFRERLDTLAHCVDDLQVAWLNYYRLDGLEKASIFFESYIDDGAKPRHAFHEAISHYENLQKPRYGGQPNYNRTRTWRKQTRVLADEGLQMCLAPETNDNVRTMVTTTSRGIKEKLCKQATILVLDAIDMCTDGTYPGKDSLEKFASLYGVIRGNADHIEEMLRLLIPRMKNPEWEVLTLSEEQYEYIMTTHGFLYKDILFDLEKVAFTILPESRRPKRMVTAIEEWDRRMRDAWHDNETREAFENLMRAEGVLD